MRAMVLAAGLGTRLRPITFDMPKPMVPVLNRPVMEHILRLLAKHGFEQTIANLYWFPDLIEEHFGDGSGCGVSLSYSREEALLGTSGGVRNASRSIAELAAEIVDKAVAQCEVDLVEVVSALPLSVMCDLLDVPAQDRELVVRVCDAASRICTIRE